MNLLLVGAGHAHLHLLAEAAQLRGSGVDVHLLAPPRFHYSGVASAVAAGDLGEAEGTVDVRDLCRRHGVQHTVGRLAALDVDARVATTEAGEVLTFDVVSLNLGSVVDLDGVQVAEEVLRTKPLDALLGLDARIRRAGGGGSGATVTVVGAGASGVELAAHLSARSDVARVRLVEAGAEIAPDLPAGARRRLRRLLADRGVDVRTGVRVEAVDGSTLTPTVGPVLPHDVALVAAGLSAPPLVARLGLGDARGIPVRATLQHRDHDHVYAAGDCAHFLPRPLPRVGVHGVRQGPVLLASLLARAGAAGRHGTSAPQPRLPTYEPQHEWLAVLDLGDGRGLATRGRWWWYGRSALWVKRWIDRRWIDTYQAPGRSGRRG